MPSRKMKRSVATPRDQSGNIRSEVVLPHPSEEKDINSNPVEKANYAEQLASKRKMIKKVQKRNSFDKNVFKGFPFLLMELMEEKELQDAIYWFENGKVFGIHTARFEKKVLQPYFKGSKMESFARKLSRWGFKRVYDTKIPLESISYRHEMFQKGRRDLLPFVRSSKDNEAAQSFKERDALPFIRENRSQSPNSMSETDVEHSILANSIPTRDMILEQPPASNISEIQSEMAEKQNLAHVLCNSGLNDAEQQRKISESIAAVRLRMLKREQELSEKILTLHNDSMDGYYPMLQGQPLLLGQPILQGQSMLQGQPTLQGVMLQGQPTLQDQSVQHEQQGEQQAQSMVMLPQSSIRYVVALPASMSGSNNFNVPVQQYHQQSFNSFQLC